MKIDLVEVLKEILSALPETKAYGEKYLIQEVCSPLPPLLRLIS
jgi:hypothetical protein